MIKKKIEKSVSLSTFGEGSNCRNFKIFISFLMESIIVFFCKVLRISNSDSNKSILSYRCDGFIGLESWVSIFWVGFSLLIIIKLHQSNQNNH